MYGREIEKIAPKGFAKLTSPQATLSTRTILANIGTLFSGTALAWGMSAVATIMIARHLGPDQFGQYTAALTLTQMIAALFSLGLDSWLLQNGSRDLVQLSHSATACLSLRVGLGTVGLMLLVVIASRLNRNTFPLTLVFLSALAWWFDAVSKTVWSAFKAVLRNHVTLGLMVVPQIVLLLTVIALVVTGMWETKWFMSARVVVFAVSGVIAVWLLIQYIGMKLQFTDLYHVLWETIPFGISNALGTICSQADVVIAAHWLDETAVGLYAPANAVIRISWMIPLAISGVMLPVLSQTYAENPVRMESAAVRLVLITALLGITVAIGIVLTARPFIRLIYGEAFLASSDVLMILALGLIARYVNSSLHTIIVAVKWQTYQVITQSFSTVISLGLSVLFVSKWGIIGLAVAYIVNRLIAMLGNVGLLVSWKIWYKENIYVA